MAWPRSTPARAALELPLAVVIGFLVLLAGTAYLYRASQRPSRRLKRDGVVVKPLTGFDWAVQEPQKFRPFKPVYHITMGLKPDTPSDLITIDRDYLDRVTVRRRLIHHHGERLHGCLPGGVGAVRELYHFLMASFLPTRFPTVFRLSSDRGQVDNLATGASHPTVAPPDAAAALRIMGETVEEDMFLLHDTPDGHKSVAFVCCFAAGFDPSTKLGKELKDIHGPVPAFDKIKPSMERFFSKLQVGNNVKRLNWVVQTHDKLLVLEAHGSQGAGKEHDRVDLGQVCRRLHRWTSWTSRSANQQETFLRVELQTLSRLPRTRALLFSFKTYLYPIRQIKDEGLGPDLATAIEGLRAGNAPGTWAYKGAGAWAEAVCGYLRD